VWSLIGENYLHLDVVLRHAFPTIVEDKPVISAERLMSNIGGILSLWLGLTVMFLVEIIELVVCVVRDRFFNNNKTKIEAVNQQQSTDL